MFCSDNKKLTSTHYYYYLTLSQQCLIISIVFLFRKQKIMALSLKKLLKPTFKRLSFISRRTVSVLVQAPSFKLAKRISFFLGKRLPKKSILERVILCACVVYPPETTSSEKTFSSFLYDNRGKILAYALGAVGVSLAIYVLAVKVQRANFLKQVFLMDPFLHASGFLVPGTGSRPIKLFESDLREYAFFIHHNVKKWTPEFWAAANIVFSSYNTTNRYSYPVSQKEMDTILLFLANMKKWK